MHVLDIAENSVAAGAQLTQISLNIDVPARRLTLQVQDNGKGMSEEMVRSVMDPFTTTRTTRKVGLGLPLLRMAAQLCEGDAVIRSTVGVGTTVTAWFTLGHIDLAPLGDMAGTVTTLIQCNPQKDFVYTVTSGSDSFTADTREMREVLGGEVSLAQPEVAVWIKGYLQENTEELLKRSMIL